MPQLRTYLAVDACCRPVPLHRRVPRVCEARPLAGWRRRRQRSAVGDAARAEKRSAEGVAMGRAMLGGRRVAQPRRSQALFPWKAAFWSMMTAIGMTSSVRRAARPSRTRAWFYDEQAIDLCCSPEFVICGDQLGDGTAGGPCTSRGVRFFELDLAEHPGVQNYKRRRLERRVLRAECHVSALIQVGQHFRRAPRAAATTASGSRPSSSARASPCTSRARPSRTPSRAMKAVSAQASLLL